MCESDEMIIKIYNLTVLLNELHFELIFFSQKIMKSMDNRMRWIHSICNKYYKKLNKQSICIYDLRYLLKYTLTFVLLNEVNIQFYTLYVKK